MAFPTSHSTRRVTVGAVFLALAGTFRMAAALPVCATPTVEAPAFMRGSTNTISWTVEDPHRGFEIEVAASPQTDGTGAFVEPIQTLTRGRHATSHEFLGLEERTYFYHLRSIDSDICTASPWSNAVETTQDQTPPQASFTTEPLSPLPYAPFLLADPVVLEGTAEDDPGDQVAVASGPDEVVVVLQPVLPAGEATEHPTTTGADGTWSVEIFGVGTGTYEAYAWAIDAVGNRTENPVTLELLVLDA